MAAKGRRRQRAARDGGVARTVPEGPAPPRVKTDAPCPHLGKPALISIPKWLTSKPCHHAGTVAQAGDPLRAHYRASRPPAPPASLPPDLSRRRLSADARSARASSSGTGTGPALPLGSLPSAWGQWWNEGTGMMDLATGRFGLRPARPHRLPARLGPGRPGTAGLPAFGSARPGAIMAYVARPSSAVAIAAHFGITRSLAQRLRNAACSLANAVSTGPVSRSMLSTGWKSGRSPAKGFLRNVASCGKITRPGFKGPASRSSPARSSPFLLTLLLFKDNLVRPMVSRPPPRKRTSTTASATPVARPGHASPPPQANWRGGRCLWASFASAAT